MEMNMPTDATKPRSSGATQEVVAGCVLGVTACAAYMALPVLLGLIADSAKLTDQQVGWLGSIELSGMLVGALLAATLLRPQRVRPLAVAALVCVALGVLGLLQSTGFPQLALSRAVGGLGAGLGNALAVVCIGHTAQSSRNQGWLNAAIIFFGGIELTAFGVLGAYTGLAGAVWPIFCVAVAGLFAVPFLATRSTDVDAHAPLQAITSATSDTGRAALWILLASTTVSQMTPAAAYAYAERLGQEQGITAASSGPLLTCGALGSGLACLAAWRFSQRWGSLKCAAFCIAGLAVVLASWVIPSHSFGAYGARVVLTPIFWALLTVFQITAMTELTGNSRWLSMVPTAQSLGLAIGPAIGASFIEDAGSLSHSMAAFATILALPLLLVLRLSVRPPDAQRI